MYLFGVLLGPTLATISLAFQAARFYSNLPGHVSIKGFETAFWQFWFC